MIRILTLCFLVCSILMSEEISIGTKMPGSDYILKNIDGEMSELISYQKENGLLVISKTVVNPAQAIDNVAVIGATAHGGVDHVKGPLQIHTLINPRIAKVIQHVGLIGFKL